MSSHHGLTVLIYLILLISTKLPAKLFPCLEFFLAPRRVLDDVMGLTRVQSPLTSSLSLSPVSTLQR